MYCAKSKSRLATVVLSTILLIHGPGSYAAEIPTPQVQPCNCTGAEREAQLLAKLRLDTKLWGASSKQVVERLLQLGVFYARKGDLTKSDEQLKAALAKVSSKGKGQNLRLEILTQQGKNRLAKQHYQEAEQLFKDALPAAKATKPKAQLYSLLGWSQAEQKHYQEALSNYEEALKLQAKLPSTEEGTTTLQQMSSVYQKLGDHANSEKMLVQAVDQTRKLKGERHPLTLFCQEQLAITLISQKHYAQAEKILEKVVSIRKSVLGEDNPQLAGTLFEYAAVLELVHKSQAAQEIRLQAAALAKSASSK